MSKRIKEMIITELRGRLGENRDMLVIDPSRMDAFSVNKLRLKLSEKGITVLNVKNTLARKALGELGVTGLDTILQGPSALVWGGPDVVALSKEIAKWAKDIKNNKLEIKGGTVEGTSLNAAQVDALSKSPGREELIGMVLSLIRSPGANLAAALLGPGGQLAGQVKQISEKEEAAEATPEAAPA
jgi:large subunit ribosomal protein L10